MPRAKGGSKTRQRRKKVLKKAKGYVGGRRKLYRTAAETVLRAAAFRAGDLPTDVDTHTYVFPARVAAQPAACRRGR